MNVGERWLTTIHNLCTWFCPVIEDRWSGIAMYCTCIETCISTYLYDFDWKSGSFQQKQSHWNLRQGSLADLHSHKIMDHWLGSGAADRSWRATLQLLTRMVCLGCIVGSSYWTQLKLGFKPGVFYCFLKISHVWFQYPVILARKWRNVTSRGGLSKCCWFYKYTNVVLWLAYDVSKNISSQSFSHRSPSRGLNPHKSGLSLIDSWMLDHHKWACTTQIMVLNDNSC